MRSRRSLDLTPQALTLTLTIVVTHSVWEQSGAPIAIVVEVGIAAALLLNLAWAWWSVTRTTITIIDCPTDAVAGDEVPAEIDVRGSHSPVDVRLVSSPDAHLYRINPPDRGRMSAVAGSRGIATAAVFDVRSGAPLGLVGVRRRFVLTLPHPLHVAPKRKPLPNVNLQRQGADDLPAEMVKGIRPYVSGDPLRLVHWPSTARTGALTVRELEPPRPPEMVLTVDLSGDRRAAEQAARHAAWLADEGLLRGLRVVLATCQSEGPTIGAVRTPREVGRRLAAAVPGPPATPPSTSNAFAFRLGDGAPQ